MISIAEASAGVAGAAAEPPLKATVLAGNAVSAIHPSCNTRRQEASICDCRSPFLSTSFSPSSGCQVSWTAELVGIAGFSSIICTMWCADLPLYSGSIIGCTILTVPS